MNEFYTPTMKSPKALFPVLDRALKTVDDVLVAHEILDVVGMLLNPIPYPSLFSQIISENPMSMR